MTEEDVPGVVADLVTKRERHGNMQIELPPIAVLQLASMIQLALRHPDLPAADRTIGGAIVAMIRGYFADCPAVVAVLDYGDDDADLTETRH